MPRADAHPTQNRLLSASLAGRVDGSGSGKTALSEISYYDVAVIGGGPAGTAAAITTCGARLRTLLLERRTEDRFQVGEGLPPDARSLLVKLGILPRFEADGHLPSYGTEAAWGSETLESNDFLSHPYGHGWHLDRTRFDASLRARAQEVGSVIQAGTRPIAVERSHKGGWQLRVQGVDGPHIIRARWIVDASGRKAWLATRLGVQRKTEDLLLGTVALFGVRPDAEDRDTLTLVEAVEYGWWYTARVPTGRRVVVFHTDSDNPVFRDAQTWEGFRQLLDRTEHIKTRLKSYHRPPLLLPRAALANSARILQPGGDGWIATGDAVAAYDPLSSQGILLALYGGLLAGQTITQELVGETGAMERYTDQIDTLYNDYLRQRARYYRQERRWPDSLFWRRRSEERLA